MTVFFRPQIFREDLVGELDHNATGACGDPALAGARKGKAARAAMADELVDGRRALYPNQIEP